MIHPIRRTRQFVHNHPVAVNAVVAVAAFGLGARVTANQWQDFVREEIGPEAIEKFFEMSE